MAVRKRKTPYSNVTKPKTPQGGWAEWRAAKGPPAIFRKPQKGESGFHRLQRLVRDTPGCDVCGTHDAITVFNREGVTFHRCTAHINATRASSGSASKEVRRKRRVGSITGSQGTKEEQDG